jgi:hyperosmotically inducible periplasmic protein
MKISKLIVALPVLALTLSSTPLVFAQSDGPSSASSDMKSAGSSAADAATEAYHGTARAVKDTAITAKVKTALHDDRITKGTDIHVDTVAGVVTLSGTAPSAEVAQRAMELAQQTSGVHNVKNAITLAQVNSSTH